MADTHLLTTSQLADATFNLGNITEMPQPPVVETASKEEMLSYLKVAKERFSKYERLYDLKQKILKDPDMAKDQRKNYFGHFYVLFGPMSSLFILIWLIVCVISWFSDNAIIQFITWKVLLALDVILTLLLSITVVRKDKVAKQDKNNEILREIDLIFSSQPISDLYVGSIPFLGEKYRYSDAARAFYEYLSNGRCKTMMDAKNLYEEELHTRRIENRIKDVEHVADVAKSLATQAISVAETALERANLALGISTAAYSKASSAQRSVNRINQKIGE